MTKNDPPNTILKGTTFKEKNCIKTIKIIPSSALIQREFHIASYNARNLYLLYNPLFYKSCCFLSLSVGQQKSPTLLFYDYD